MTLPAARDLSVALRDHGKLEEAGPLLERVLDRAQDPDLRARAGILQAYQQTMEGHELAAAVERSKPLIRTLEKHGAEDRPEHRRQSGAEDFIQFEVVAHTAD